VTCERRDRTRAIDGRTVDEGRERARAKGTAEDGSAAAGRKRSSAPSLACKKYRRDAR